MGLLLCGIEKSWNLSKRCCVATSFSGSYHFPRNLKLLSVTSIVSTLLSPPRSEVLRPKHFTLGKCFLFRNVKPSPATTQPSA